MFNLLRYFSLTGGIVLIVVAVALVALYRHHAVVELVESTESQNVFLARSFANTLWPRYSEYVISATGMDGDALRAREETAELHEALKTLTEGLPVLKIKIYNLDGLTVYSSQRSQMGGDKSNNLEFLRSAKEGEPASKQSYRDTFITFSGVVRNRDLVESYLPIWGPDGVIEGVFELYTDVTPLMAKVDRDTASLTVGIIVAFGSLFAVLFLIARHADAILKRQYAELLKSARSIGAKNEELEDEITERKQTARALEESEAHLRVAHDTLEERVKMRTMELEKEISQRQHAEEELQEQVGELEAAKLAIEQHSARATSLAEELAVARDQANAANRAKSEFLATMSHELRTPLNAIIGFSEIIETETLGPIGSVKYREYASDIHESGRHLLDLINDILDLSKVESGMDELHEENVDISVVADSVFRLVRQRAEKHGVKLELEISGKSPLLRVDERKVKQILVNLLSNAIKFTKAGGTVSLKGWCRMESGYVFQVIDNGIGIAIEDIPKALSQFGQVDSALNRQHEGTGLGLSLTKLLVELHGGSLDLQSDVGVGTTVTVRFPAERIVDSPRDTESVVAADRKAG